MILLLAAELEESIWFLPNTFSEDDWDPSGAAPFSMTGGRYIGVIRRRPSVVRTSICLSSGPGTNDALDNFADSSNRFRGMAENKDT